MESHSLYSQDSILDFGCCCPTFLKNAASSKLKIIQTCRRLLWNTQKISVSLPASLLTCTTTHASKVFLYWVHRHLKNHSFLETHSLIIHSPLGENESSKRVHFIVLFQKKISFIVEDLLLRIFKRLVYLSLFMENFRQQTHTFLYFAQIIPENHLFPQVIITESMRVTYFEKALLHCR